MVGAELVAAGSDVAVVEGVPLLVEGIPTLGSVVTEVDSSGVVDYSRQHVGAVVSGGVLGLRHQSAQVKSSRKANSGVNLLLAPLSVGKAFELEHQHPRQTEQAELPSRLTGLLAV